MEHLEGILNFVYIMFKITAAAISLCTEFCYYYYEKSRKLL